MAQQQAFNHDMKYLCDVIYDWMKQILYEREDACGLWLDTVTGPGFEWVLINDVEYQGPCVGVVPIPDKNDKTKITGYNIYNYFLDFRHVNITIRDGKVKWWNNQDTEFRDFTHDQMYSLYEMICEKFNQKPEKENDKLIEMKEAE